MKLSLSIALAATFIASLLAACGSESTPATKPAPATLAAAKPVTPLIHAHAPGALDWCKEHAMPESVCVQCHPDLADAYQKKNDWCKEHALPESQCFKCHPELQAKFAADYKAKVGKEPPAP